MTNRRDFLKAAAFGLAAAHLNAGTKPMKGIFPIMQTPYQDSGRLDTETLAREVKFLEKVGVHGVVWPQLASEWSTLEPDERTSGAKPSWPPPRRARWWAGVQADQPRAAAPAAADKLAPTPSRRRRGTRATRSRGRILSRHGKECGLPPSCKPSAT
jgi:hypothetical protein